MVSRLTVESCYLVGWKEHGGGGGETPGLQLACCVILSRSYLYYTYIVYRLLGARLSFVTGDTLVFRELPL